MKALRTWAGTSGKKLASVEGLAQIWKGLGTPGKGAAIGLAVALPFLPGMLGSRKTGNELRDVYSGVDEVPVRSGRWWELGSTPFEGARIKAWRPHWSVLHKARAEDISLCGSEEKKWKHNPILHPLRWLKDPSYLEKLHYQGQTSFPLICHLSKALQPVPHIINYVNVYKSFARCMLRPCLIRLPALAGSGPSSTKLRHLAPARRETAPPETDRKTAPPAPGQPQYCAT